MAVKIEEIKACVVSLISRLTGVLYIYFFYIFNLIFSVVVLSSSIFLCCYGLDSVGDVEAGVAARVNDSDGVDAAIALIREELIAGGGDSVEALDEEFLERDAVIKHGIHSFGSESARSAWELLQTLAVLRESTSISTSTSKSLSYPLFLL
ncbi:hypothetical protein RJT34_12216 [Clitoria ternatea]|uniref:Uncharacterized protein n=1 Tax=Clitoria ternatea TaxID=43366 RepID=A0AAN9PKG4_CLITE